MIDLLLSIAIGSTFSYRIARKAGSEESRLLAVAYMAVAQLSSLLAVASILLLVNLFGLWQGDDEGLQFTAQVAIMMTLLLPLLGQKSGIKKAGENSLS